MDGLACKQLLVVVEKMEEEGEKCRLSKDSIVMCLGRVGAEILGSLHWERTGDGSSSTQPDYSWVLPLLRDRCGPLLAE